MSVAPQVVTTASSAPLSMLFGPSGAPLPSSVSFPAMADQIGPPRPDVGGTACVAVFEPTHGRIALRIASTGPTAVTLVVERWNRVKAESPEKAHWTGRRDFLIFSAASGTKVASVTDSTAIRNDNGTVYWNDSAAISSDVSIGPAPAAVSATADVAVVEFDRRGAELIVIRAACGASNQYINLAIEQINAG